MIQFTPEEVLATILHALDGLVSCVQKNESARAGESAALSSLVTAREVYGARVGEAYRREIYAAMTWEPTEEDRWHGQDDPGAAAMKIEIDGVMYVPLSPSADSDRLRAGCDRMCREYCAWYDSGAVPADGASMAYRLYTIARYLLAGEELP